MYYKLGQLFLLQIGASIVTNWGSYYKLRELLLRNREAITNWGKFFYKLDQLITIRMRKGKRGGIERDKLITYEKKFEIYEIFKQN